MSLVHSSTECTVQTNFVSMMEKWWRGSTEGPIKTHSLITIELEEQSLYHALNTIKSIIK